MDDFKKPIFSARGMLVSAKANLSNNEHTLRNLGSLTQRIQNVAGS